MTPRAFHFLSARLHAFGFDYACSGRCQEKHFYDLGVIGLAGIRTVASEITTRTSAA